MVRAAQTLQGGKKGIELGAEENPESERDAVMALIGKPAIATRGTRNSGLPRDVRRTTGRRAPL